MPFEYVCIENILNSSSFASSMCIYFILRYTQDFNEYIEIHFESVCIENILTHSFPIHPFSTPWKHQETVRFSYVVRGKRKGALGTNGLSAPKLDKHFIRFISKFCIQFTFNYLHSKRKNNYRLIHLKIYCADGL